jgi:hypothetical protein
VHNEAIAAILAYEQYGAALLHYTSHLTEALLLKSGVTNGEDFVD